MELYLPEAWLTDPEFESRRQDARIPDDLAFRTNPEIALDLIERAVLAEVPHACIGADADFGDSRAFRAQLRAWDEPYVLGVTPSKSELRVIPEDTPIEHPDEYDGTGPTPTVPRYPEAVSATSPAEIAAEREDDEEAWTMVRWTEGSKGRQSAEFLRRRVRIVTDTGRRAVSEETGWLLVQRRDGEVKAWVCWGVDEWSLERLVLYAHQRWTIEQFHREAKQFLGINEFEGRTWGGSPPRDDGVVGVRVPVARARPAGERLPPLSEVARAVRRETCIQELVDEQGMDREVAERAAGMVLRVLFAET